MAHLVRTATLAWGLTLALSVQAAAPAKSAKAAKPAPAKAAKSAAPAEPVEIDLAHQLTPTAEGLMGQLVERFNREHPGYAVKLMHRDGSGKPALLNLVRREDLGEFVTQKGSLKPLYQVMSEAKVTLAGGLSSDLKAGATDEKGRLLALPVAYSTPVLFYNKAAFRKAGLDPEQAPRTWREVQDAAGKLYDAGVACPYTSSWPAWIHIDNLSALSSVPVATAKGELTFNGLPQVKHVAMLASWFKSRYFHDYGRRNEADQHFASGECAMITTDSSAHTEFKTLSGMDVGVAPLPHHDDVYGGRQHTLADGASLWVGGGFKAAEYKAVARFVAFLMAPESQVELAGIYGELPLTQAARLALKSKSGPDHATVEVVQASLKGEGAIPALRVSAIGPVDGIVAEELEAVWKDQKPAKAALDAAVERGNALLTTRPALKKASPL